MSGALTRFGDATLQTLLRAPGAGRSGGVGVGRGVTLVLGTGSERRIGYDELARLARARLARWRRRGAGAGDRVILLLEDRASFLECLHAAFLGALVPVPVAGGISDEHRAKLYAIARTLASSGTRPWLATDARTLERLEGFATANGLGDAHARLVERALAVPHEGEPDQGLDDEAESPAAGLDDVALIQFSSGSTGTPKGVVLTHANVLANVDGILDGMAMRDDDVMSSWMPLTHDMGLIGFHLVPRLAGIDHVLMPTELFVRRPALWLEGASAHRASVLCSPNFGYEHCLKTWKPERAAALDLSRVRLVFNGAEPISAAVAQRFLDAYAGAGLAREAMFPVYGLAEASLAVSFPAVGAPLDVRHVARGSLGIGDPVRIVAADDPSALALVGVGRPIAHVEVRIADNAGSTLADGSVGRVLMRGPNVTSGYLVAAGALDTSTIDAEGWLDTGDLGAFLPGSGGPDEGVDPALFITGRAKDIVFASGQNLYPSDLEATLVARGVGEPGKVVVAAAPTADAGVDLLVAFVQFRAGDDAFGPLARAARAAMSEAAGVRLDLVVPVPRVPKTTSGKVQRYRLVEALLAGEHDAALAASGQSLAEASAAAASRPEPGATGEGEGEGEDPAGDRGEAAPRDVRAIEARLLDICRVRVEGVPVGADDNLFELGISSLVLASIHADIEALWPGALDITDLFDHPTVGEIATVLAARAD